MTVINNAPTSTTAVLAGTDVATISFGTFHFNIPLTGIAVHLVAVGSTSDAVPPATTASNGFYEFDNVPPGSYQVEFVDPTGKYSPQWYNGTATGSPNQAGASTVTLTAGNATTGVNASQPFHN